MQIRARSSRFRSLALLPALALLVLYGVAPETAAAQADDGTADAEAAAAGDEERRLPDFQVFDETRLPYDSADWIGEPLLVDFWATWCGPCRFTLPELQELHEEYADRDLRVIGISLDTGAGGGVRATNWAEERGIDYEIFHDARAEARRALGVTNIPVLFLVDEDGRIVADWWGEPDFAEVRARIEEVLPAATDPTADSGNAVDREDRDSR